MAATYTFTTDAVGNPESIVVQSVCYRIVLRPKDRTSNTINFLIRVPLATSPAIIYDGSDGKAIFCQGKPYQVGDIVGYVEAASGSILMAQLEDVDDNI